MSGQGRRFSQHSRRVAQYARGLGRYPASSTTSTGGWSLSSSRKATSRSVRFPNGSVGVLPEHSAGFGASARLLITVYQETPSLRQLEPEHLIPPMRGALLSRSRNAPRSGSTSYDSDVPFGVAELISGLEPSGN